MNIIRRIERVQPVIPLRVAPSHSAAAIVAVEWPHHRYGCCFLDAFDHPTHIWPVTFAKDMLLDGNAAALMSYSELIAA